ncbi:MAG: hypothetical protein M3269_03825, partial [Thermoproteota archaeon]|nr:hypothetical protein [Thermoproteota archaeon]
MANLSFDNSAYGQEQSVEVDDNRVNIEGSEEQTVDDERSQDNSNNDTSAYTTPIEIEVDDETGEDTQPPREVDDETGEDTQPSPPPPPQVQQPSPPPPPQVQQPSPPP